MKTLNKTILLIIVTLGLHLQASSQGIDKLYINMPDALNPTLSKQNRLELIEYYKVRQNDSILNRFGNQVHILERDTIQQRLVIQNTPNSTFEMMVIKKSETSSLIGIIRTVCAPVCSSSIRFYNSKWNLSSIQFKTPKASEWLNKDSLAVSTLDKKWVESILNDSFISLSFSTENHEIIAQNNILDFLSDMDKKAIAPLLINKSFSYKLVEKTWVKK